MTRMSMVGRAPVARYLQLHRPAAASGGSSSSPPARAFTSEPSDDNTNNGSNSNRVPVTLYRQLLLWCRQYDGIPFNPLPPATLAPPQVNLAALRRLGRMRSFLASNEIKESASGEKSHVGLTTYGNGGGHIPHPHPAHFALYGDSVDVKGDMITFSDVNDAAKLRDVIRSVFWLNNRGTVADVAGGEGEDEARGETEGSGRKEQISLAFETLKECNELASRELDPRRSKRERNVRIRQGSGGGAGDGEGYGSYPKVEFHVGDVVKHNGKSWRGVIVGWDFEVKSKNPGLTSLTTKQYSIPPSSSEVGSPSTDVPSLKYTVLVDMNDAQSVYNKYETEEIVLGKSIELVFGEDLSIVDDPCLQRIHNSLINRFFTKFDARGHFVPNDMLAFVYPTDRFSRCKYDAIENDNAISHDLKLNAELEKSYQSIIKGVGEISRRLLESLEADEQQQQIGSNSEASALISSLKSSAESMIGESESSKQGNADLSISLLAKLYHFHVRANALLWTRNDNQKHTESIEFSLGDVVKHKVYGFRGVVSAWDTKPRMDVSNWDGLKEVQNPNEKPFYHLYPDVNDCIAAFGSPRHYRENLELCDDSANRLDLSTDMEDLGWQWDGEKERYVPSAEMKFMYAEDLGEHESGLVATVEKLRNTLTGCLLEVRNQDNITLFSMDDLFNSLSCGVQNFQDANVLSDLIKEIWKENSLHESRHQLDASIADLHNGKHESALKILSDVVARDPAYGEAWSKKATVHYMLGDIKNSLECAEEALKIEPRNFQAIAGIGLIKMDNHNIKAADSAFRRCLAINPWLGTVASRLNACIRTTQGPE